MAEPLPAALKIPEVSRFINRANQLRSFKPAIAYWCEYRAVNQIVSKSLHTSDDDAFSYTKMLLERLETVKSERPDDDAIMDNTAGQAYVEQFAQETFGRAERTMHANKVTRQTADTFDAAATFFDLTHEWGTPDAETLQKIKFAKWNAARILKAIREGKDPNDSNPKVQDDDEAALGLDPEAPDAPGPSAPRAASVEEVPDVGELPPAQQPPAPAPTHEGYFPPGPPPPPAAAPSEPFAPSPMSNESAPSAPGMPPAPPAPQLPTHPETQVPPQPSPQIPTKLPPQFTPQQEVPPAPQAPPAPSAPAAPTPWTAPPPLHPNPPPPPAPAPAQPPPSAYKAPPPAPPPAAQSSAGLTQETKDINQAQKHAKWAISALNFEDVPTAVNELRNALAMLGAR